MLTEIKEKCESIARYCEFIEERKKLLDGMLAGLEEDELTSEIKSQAQRLLQEEIRERERAVRYMVSDLNGKKKKPKKSKWECELDCFNCPFDDCITVEDSKKIADEYKRMYREYLDERQQDNSALHDM